MAKATVVGRCSHCGYEIHSYNLFKHCPECQNALPPEIIAQLDLAKAVANASDHQLSGLPVAPTTLKYESRAIYEFAARLYGKADAIIAVYTLIGFVVGFVPGKVTGSTGTAVVIGAIAGAIGFWLGSERAFQLKLQAQMALCQVQIEENTRGVSGGSLPHTLGAIPSRSAV